MSNRRVRDLMTLDVHVVHPDDPLATVRDVMSEKHIRHVPVVDGEGDIVGWSRSGTCCAERPPSRATRDGASSRSCAASRSRCSLPR